jgi:hypothetical protein
MVAREPQLRRRGFFLHSSDTSEPDTAEHENPEGFVVRVRATPTSATRRMVSGSSRFSGGRQARTEGHPTEDQPAIRSGSVTGSRQRAHLPR